MSKRQSRITHEILSDKEIVPSDCMILVKSIYMKPNEAVAYLGEALLRDDFVSRKSEKLARRFKQNAQARINRRKKNNDLSTHWNGFYI